MTGGGTFEVRIHGRGGQGVVTAAELLSVAAFDEGRYAQAFPSFGSERTGAPVVAFCRISDREIRVREPVMLPDALIIQDQTLIHQVNVFDGLAPDGYVLINSQSSFEELGLEAIATPERAGRLMTIPATELAKEHLGRPVPNIVMLAGWAAQTGLVSMEALSKAISERFTGRVAEGNVEAAVAAAELIGQIRKADQQMGFAPS